MSSKKGFSGLDDLSSDIDDILNENHKDINNTIEEKTESKDDKTNFSNNETVDSEKTSSTTPNTNNASTVTNNDSNNGSSFWIWCVIVVGANEQFPHRDILVIDAGTCITYEFIDSKGQYHGGNISPGMQMRFKALHQFTGRLPLVDTNGRKLPMGRDTETAIRAGVMKGMEYEISGYIESMKHKYPELLVFLTGGDDFSFDSSVKSIIFADRFLVLKGLNRILNYNNGRI
jgi:pantothenate kinase type III